MRTRKYKFEGARSGYCRPFVMEARPYIIKIKEECANEFLSELKGSTEEMSGSNRAIPRLSNYFIKLVSKALGLFFRDYKDKFRQIDMRMIPTGENTMFEWFKTQVVFSQSDVVRNRKEEL